MIQRLLDLWVRVLLRHRWIVLAGVLGLTGLSVWVLSKAYVSTSVIHMFMDDDNPDLVRYKEGVARYGNDDVVLIGVEGVNPLEPATLDRLQALTRQLEAHPAITKVTSVADLARTVNEDDAISIRKVADEVRAHPDRAGPLLRELATDERTAGLLLSNDGRSFVVAIELTYDEERPVEETAKLLTFISERFEANGFAPEQLRTTGLSRTMVEVLDQSMLNLQQLLPIVAALLLVIVLLMFGRLWPVTVTGAIAALTVLFTMAFAVALDPQIHIFLSLVPGVIVIISFSDLIHMISAYLLELGAGHAKEEAIRRACVEVGEACFLTSATTFVGFFALTLVPTPAFRQFGLVVGVGVVIAFVLAISITPVFFAVMKTPDPWHQGRAGLVQRALDRLLGVVSRLTVERPWHAIGGFVLFTLVCIGGAVQVDFEANLSQRLGPDNPVRVDQAWFEEHFIGATTIDVLLSVEAPGTLLEGDMLNGIADLQDQIEAMPGIDRTLSLLDVLRQTFEAFVGPELAGRFLPLTTEKAAQLMLIVEGQPQEELDPLVDFGRRHLRIVAYTHERGALAHAAMGEHMRALAQQTLGDAVQVDIYGIRYLLGSWVDDVLDGQRNGIILSLLGVTVLLIVGLHSFSAGLGSMIPNLLPLLALAGYCGWFWDQTDTDTTIVAMIAVGIGVDDTIHFLARLRLERQRGASVKDAIARTFHFSGRGIVITTVIFVLGFAPFLMSDYLPIGFMGLLLPLAFAVALAGDLLLLPALVRVGVIRFPGPTNPDDPA